jgi:8-hydroxy-5-deazaflavin:NADPH oxidoreductase
VPLDPDNPRKMKMPAAGSATEEAQAFFGADTKVVAAFQNVAAHLLRDPKHAIDCDVLVAGDDKDARATVIGLIQKMGMQAYDVGTADGARVVEGLTSIMIRLNIRNKVKGAGIRLTGLPR